MNISPRMRSLGMVLVASASCVGPTPDQRANQQPTFAAAPAGEDVDPARNVVGRVEAADGTPLARAWVALNGLDGSPISMVESDEQGRFRVPRPEQAFALTATAAQSAGVFLSVDDLAAIGKAPIQARLGPSEKGLVLHGRVSVAGGAPPSPFLLTFGRYSQERGDIFVASVSSDGTFTLTVPPGSYFAKAHSSDVVSTTVRASGGPGDRVALNFEMSLRAPAPKAAVAWVKANAIALNSADPTAADDDLAPLVVALGAARIIGVGESTHGTSEFFRIKQRLFQRLVKEHGVTTLAMEANVTDAEFVDEYVRTGRGTVDEAIKHLFLVWQTQEVRDLLLWMRAYNADAKHRRKLRFIGYDVQSASGPIAKLRAYLRKVDRASEALIEPLASLEPKPGSGGAVELTAQQKVETRDAAARLVEVFSEKKATFLARSTAADYAAALHYARIIAQAQARFAESTPEEQFASRDLGMAENVAWLAERAGPDERMMVWAHNGHVRHHSEGLLGRNMGTRLREQFGEDYISVGFVLNQGEYRATVDRAKPRETVLVPLDSSAPGYLAETFTRVGLPIFALDLRRAPAGTVRDWLSAPHLVHSCGWLVSEVEQKGTVGSITKRFDLIIYADRTTGATRLPK